MRLQCDSIQERNLMSKVYHNCKDAILEAKANTREQEQKQHFKALVDQNIKPYRKT